MQSLTIWMTVYKVIGIGITLTITVVIIRQTRPDLSSVLLIAGGALLSLYIIDMLEDVFGVFSKILETTNLDSALFFTLLKIVGIGYLTEFSASVCNDSGNSSIAQKIQLAGKLTILILSIPIISKLLDLLVGLIK